MKSRLSFALHLSGESYCKLRHVEKAHKTGAFPKSVSPKLRQPSPKKYGIDSVPVIFRPRGFESMKPCSAQTPSV